MRCRASHFSVTRVPARDETAVVTHESQNIAALVPAEVWAARQRRPTDMVSVHGSNACANANASFP